MLDLSPKELERYRKVATDRRTCPTARTSRPHWRCRARRPRAGSRLFPSDLDFFERIHITAPTREEACRILADVIRERRWPPCAARPTGCCEVKFGTWDGDGRPRRQGQSTRATRSSWTPAEVEGGRDDVIAADGSPRSVSWEDAAQNPGWCKLDWVVADPERGQLSNASNVLDPTWEAPDGKIVAARRLPGPVFPGGLPRHRCAAAVRQAGQGAVDGRRRHGIRRTLARAAERLDAVDAR